MELQKFLDEANEKTFAYSQTFKNLFPEESKTIETFDKNNVSEKKRLILSELIIYEPTAEPKNSSLEEFHNVREVDGKPMKNRDRRALKLFEKLSDTDSFEKELDKIDLSDD